MRVLSEILKEDNFDYLVRPILETNELSNHIKSSNFNKSLIKNWYKYDSILYNPYFTCSYLHIIKNEDSTFSFSIFSSIENEHLYIKADDGLDKTWITLFKNKTLDELVVLINSKLEKYIKKWNKRDDSSQQNEKKKFSINYNEFWFKCIVKNTK